MRCHFFLKLAPSYPSPFLWLMFITALHLCSSSCRWTQLHHWMNRNRSADHAAVYEHDCAQLPARLWAQHLHVLSCPLERRVCLTSNEQFRRTIEMESFSSKQLDHLWHHSASAPLPVIWDDQQLRTNWKGWNVWPSRWSVKHIGVIKVIN